MGRLRDGMADDVRRAWREARRRPLSTLGTSGMLALGIGLTTALFGAVDAVLLNPLPVTGADQVQVVWTRHDTRGYAHYPITHGAFEAVAGNARTLADVAAVDAHGWSEMPLAEAGAARSVRQARVLGDFFGLLGVRPVLGRTTVPGDALPGDAGFAVIAHGFWQRALGGSPDVIGRTLRVGQRSLTVVGVLPSGFDYPRGAQLWTPMRPIEDARPQLELDLVVRVRAGAAPAQAATEIGRLLRSDGDLSRIYDGTAVVTRPLRDHLLGNVRPILLVLMAGAALVLGVAMANAANLLLVRGAVRAPQFAIRLALGADRRRLVRQLFAEGVVTGVSAGLLGLALGWLALRLLVPLAPAETPGLDGATLDLRALAFATLISAAVVAVCTIVPGLAAARLTPAAVLSGGRRIAGRRTRRSLSRRGLGAVQVALAVAALIGANLLVRSFQRLRALDPGFAPESLQLVNLAVPYDVFAVPETYHAALEYVAGQLASRSSDVRAATPVLSAPLLESGGYAAPLLREGQPTLNDARENPLLSIEIGLPDYFETMAIEVRRGRVFDAGDHAGSPRVLVVNETTARLLWPDADAVGQRVRLPFPDHTDEEWTVVGIVADTRYAALLEPRPMLYLPLLQFRSFAPRHLLVRTNGPAAGLPEATQRALDATDPRVRVLGVASVAEILDRPLAGPRFAAVVLAIFAVAAVLLAAAGVYAVLGAAVRERTREFGIRLALGARMADIWRLVLGHGLALAAAGIPIGLVAALVAARSVEALLFDIEPADPMTLAGALAAIVAAVVLAGAGPALRAGRVDPAETLRAD